jgi:putative transposase
MELNVYKWSFGMVRQPRKRCESGFYHVTLRGVNRGDIFLDKEDCQRFLHTLEQKKRHQEYVLYGYCLMSNHVHLLVQEKEDTISRIMSRIGTSYAKCFNQKYNRTGHLFQGRYGSECIEDDQYLLTVIRYIHNNPVKAGLVKEAEAYKWSSIHAYMNDQQANGLVDTEFILGMFHQDRATAISAFREFMKEDHEDICLQEVIPRNKTDEQVKAEIVALMGGEPIANLRNLDKEKCNRILRTIKASEGVTLRQIARVTGFNVMRIYRA